MAKQEQKTVSTTPSCAEKPFVVAHFDFVSYRPFYKTQIGEYRKRKLSQ